MVLLRKLLPSLLPALLFSVGISGELRAEEPPPAPADEQAILVAEPAEPILPGLLDPVLDDSLLLRSPASVHVVHAATGEEVYAYKADRALLPASTMKVVTTAAALRTLGSAWRFSTEILHDGDLGDDGVLQGNLYVRGGGDPTLVLERLWKLVQEVRLEGVREVRGDVVFDDTAFDNDPGIPGWHKKQDLEDGPAYFPALGALSLNFNTVALFVGPGSSPGEPARVELETPSAVIEVQNHVTTGPSNGRRWLKLERQLEGSQTRFVLSGVIPARSSVRRYYRSVGDPTAYFTGAFAALCKQQGISTKGHFVQGATPAAAELLVRLESDSLATILQRVDKHSNNFMAEQVLKAMGGELLGAPGTTEKGLQVVRDYLDGLGIPEDDYHLVNGSGLSRQIEVRPDLLTAVLLDMHDDRLVGSEFRSALAIGGLDGTLRSRFRDDDHAGRVRGKTGSLNGVHCLAGYVDAADGEVYAFAFLVNEIRGPLSRARRLQDRFVETLLELGDSPEVAVAEDEAPGDTGE